MRINTHHIIKALCLLMLLPMYGIASEYYITPLKMEIAIPPNGNMVTSSVRVNSVAKRKIKLRVILKNWTLHEDGRLRYVQEPTDGFDAFEMVRVNPEEFELNPGQTRLVRFAVKAPPEMPAGEYRFQLIFQPEQTFVDKQTQAIADPGKVNVSLNIATISALTVYAVKGTAAPEVKMKTVSCNYDPQTAKLAADFSIDNVGTRHARLKGNLIVNKKEPSGQLRPTQVYPLGGSVMVILPGTPRTFHVMLPPAQSKEPLKWAAGDYQLELQLVDTRNVQPAVRGTCDVHIPEASL